LPKLVAKLNEVNYKEIPYKQSKIKNKNQNRRKNTVTRKKKEHTWQDTIQYDATEGSTFPSPHTAIREN